MKVSILLPVSRKNYLEEAINSILQSTFKDYEVIIVDDYSDAWDMVQRYSSYSNFIIKRNEKSLGHSANFVKAFSYSSGEYIFMCADDDLLYPDTLEKLVKTIEEEKCDGVYTKLQTIDNEGNNKDIWGSVEYDEHTIEKLFSGGANVITETIFSTREFFDKYYNKYYRERVITPIWLGNYKNIKLKYLKEPLYKYRIHDNNCGKDIKGLYSRNNSIINHMNASIINYSPSFTNIPDTLYQYIETFFYLSNNYMKGHFYTGIDYNEDDKLYIPFLMMAKYWINLYRNSNKIHFGVYNIIDEILRHEALFSNVLFTRGFYYDLPLTAYRPYYNSERFCVMDIINFDTKIEDCEHEEIISGEFFKNYINISTIDSLEKYLDENIISCINIANNEKQVINFLKDKKLYFMPLYTNIEDRELNIRREECP